MSDFLTVVEVLSIHGRVLGLWGGTPGVRDMGLLEAALFRPQTGCYTDVIQEAAALWESLSSNHPFLDGNKRVALAAADVFLQSNGVQLVADPDEVYLFLEDLYENHRFGFAELERWLRGHCVRVR